MAWASEGRLGSACLIAAKFLYAALVVLAVVTSTRQAQAANGTDPTRISLPKGPASVEGLGRSFVPSLASGTASYGIDIAVPPSSGGTAPKLTLDYDAGGGVSEIGMGWHLGGVPRIRRRTENGLPRFDASDTFELVGLGTPCDLLEVQPGVFRPQYETGAFVRLTRSQDGATWEVRDKSGMIYRFGGAGFTEQESGNVATYLLRDAEDRHGHSLRYEWDTVGGYALLLSVTWNDFSDEVQQRIDLAYDIRPDAQDLFSSGIRRTLSKRLSTIAVKLGGQLVRRYALTYTATPHSLLESVQMFGSDGTTSLPTLSFGYTKASFSADGKQIVTMQSPPGHSPGDPDAALADFDGDSLPDLLIARQNQYRTYLNSDGMSWQPAADWAPGDTPAVALSSTGAQLADVDADGAMDLLVKSGSDLFRYLPGKDATHFASQVDISTVPNFTFEDPDVRLADMDGDRRTDVVITTAVGLAIGYNLNGKDWTEPRVIGKVDPAVELQFSRGSTYLCDVNGDRIQDFCYLRPTSLLYWLGRGRGIFEMVRTATNVPDFDLADPWKLVDLNGDGWVDLVHVGTTVVSAALAVGVGKFEDVRSIADVPTKDSRTTTIEFADMNGSGTTDIVWIDVSGSPENAWKYLEIFPDGRAGLLQSIDNGLGKITRVDYETAALNAARSRATGKAWTSRLNVAMPVVKRVSVDSSLGDPQLVTSYAYGEGAWDPTERTFAGFGTGTQTEIGDAYTPSLITESTFDTGLRARVLRGVVRTSEQRDANGYIFSRTKRDYTVQELARSLLGRLVEYGYASSERVEHVEGTDAAKARVTLTEWREDGFGNRVLEQRWGEIAGDDKLVGNDEAITRRSYANNTGSWLLGFLVTEALEDAAGNRYSLQRNYYDTPPDDPTSWDGLPLGEVTRGDLVRQEEWLGPEPDQFELAISTRYTADGQPKETKDARGGGRIYEWDPTDRTTLLSEQVKLETGVRLVESAVTDRLSGNLLSVTGYNGKITELRYDPLGRLTKIIKPGDTENRPTVQYTYQVAKPLSRIVTEARVVSGSTDVETAETLFDGLGRQRATLTRSENNQWVLAGVALLDARAQGRRTLRARFVGEAQHAAVPLQQDAAGISSWRDAAAREARTRSQMGIETRTQYEPFMKKHWDGGQTDTDPNSPYEHLPAVENVDGLGRVVNTARYLKGTAVSASFTYDVRGQLRSRTDPEGNRSTYQYDGRGRRTVVDDPDLGRREFVWDATGNLVRRRNPDGNVIVHTFDLAGRPLTEDWNNNGTPEVRRTWDLAPDGAADPRYLGKLAKTTDPSCITEQEFDDRGRPTRTHLTIDGHRYTTGYDYDAQDRETLHRYPDSSTIRIRRNLRGQISSYGADAVHIDYDGDGLETDRRFNTGVKQHTAYDDDRRLNELSVTAKDGAAIEHLKWTLDNAGNLRKQEDLRPAVTPESDRTESYVYDNLYRLVGAAGTWGNTGWTYSPSGNLTARASTVADQQADAIGYEKGSHPHAMRTYRGRTITYDALGRMLSDGVRTFVWNEVDKLARVTGDKGASVDNKFDAGGERRVRTEHNADGTTAVTVFVDAWSEFKNGNVVRYIVHAGRRIAELARDSGTNVGSVFGEVSTRESHRASRASPEPAKPNGNATKDFASLLLLGILIGICLHIFPGGGRSRTKAMLAMTAILCGACEDCQPGEHLDGHDSADAGNNDSPSHDLGDAGNNDSPSNDLDSAADRPEDGQGPAVGRAVELLTEADTLLFYDQIGSLLHETNGQGVAAGRFAVYPYGAARYDTTAATRRYANSVRDIVSNVDEMGARYYSNEFGAWTAADPALAVSPELVALGPLNTGHYGYARNSPVNYVDATGFWPRRASDDGEESSKSDRLRKEESLAPWLKPATSELKRNTTRVAGAGNNPRILNYISAAKGLKTSDYRTDETAWCSCFVNWVLQRAGYRGTDNALAASWRTWGEGIDHPVRGAVAIVIENGQATHVAFFSGYYKEGVVLLGGNQSPSSKVTESRWRTEGRADRRIEYRVPSDYGHPAAHLLGRALDEAREAVGIPW
jgi:uncharacterized protein (TIGR02594 family)